MYTLYYKLKTELPIISISHPVEENIAKMDMLRILNIIIKVIYNSLCININNYIFA